MSIAMRKLRSTPFWILDAVKAREIRNAYESLKAFDATGSKSPKLLEHQEFALQELLHHAATTTKFYREFGKCALSDYPIINKGIIREKQDDFMSNEYDRKDLFIMTTSGSTGTPFVCYQDTRKKKSVIAEVIYYSEKAGYMVGSNLIYLRVITKENYKSKLKQLIYNETLLDISNLDDQRIAILLSRLKKASHAGSMMLAYASTYDALAEFFKRKGVSGITGCNINGIVSSSELLIDQTRDVLEKAFNCRCFSRYSNQENGVIGQDDVENNTFILNETHYLTEILKMDVDELAQEGEVGRIVITDLYNYAMPMIRYDTGDVGSIKFIERGGINKKAISNFGGRKVDVVFDSLGNRLSPHLVTNNLWSFPELRQFQFIQVNKAVYKIKINTRGEFGRKDELRSLMHKLLGPNAAITIEVVDEIPVLASGKRKYIVNMGNHQ